jgi:hypothetical protein
MRYKNSLPIDKRIGNSVWLVKNKRGGYRKGPVPLFEVVSIAPVKKGGNDRSVHIASAASVC